MTHIVSKLDIDELFRAASACIRSYWRDELSGYG